MKELDFGWGNPYFLLDILSTHKDIVKTSALTRDCSYGPDAGNLELIAKTREIIRYTTGQEYKNVLITHGATGAINSALRFFKDTGIDKVRTTKFGYPFYEEMIEKAGLERVRGLIAPRPPHKSIALIDSPSNPEGLQTLLGSPLQDIWDSVYHNKIYTDDLKIIPGHSIMVGSYSKLLGITGARVGWLATDCDFTYDAILKDTLHELATISLFSQGAVLSLLDNLDIEGVLATGKKDLDSNKTQVQKIEYIFDNQPVQKNGMFYLAQADKAALKLLERCKIKYVSLQENYIRLNMGQSKKIVNELALRIRKEDRILKKK
jgi:aspartate/methionine/tyrosine aminotransferase